MTLRRFQEITGAYPDLRIAVVGDFCLDRYFEIDPSLRETSLETGLEVRNIVRTRVQPGAAGTILSNLSALGVGALPVAGFCGADGEGHLLRQALEACPGADLRHFLEAEDRTTFTYTKPLVMEPGGPPRELCRLDQKNWTRTPGPVSLELARSVERLAGEADAMVVLDQVDRPGTGAVTPEVLRVLGRPAPVPVLADCRRGLAGYPPLDYKMNRSELQRMLGGPGLPDAEAALEAAGELARRNRRRVFVTLAEEGIVGAGPGGDPCHLPALPVAGPIDIVGAGDAVTAGLAAALAARATLEEAMALAMASAKVVVQQLGTTGSARREQILPLVCGQAP